MKQPKESSIVKGPSKSLSIIENQTKISWLMRTFWIAAKSKKKISNKIEISLVNARKNLIQTKIKIKIIPHMRIQSETPTT